MKNKYICKNDLEMTKNIYSLNEVTQAVNHWSMTKLTSAEVLYFLKSIREEECPPFPHNIKEKIILLTEDEIKSNKAELKKWTDQKWILQTIFKL